MREKYDVYKKYSDDLVQAVAEKDPFQKKYFESFIKEYTEEEVYDFGSLIEFYIGQGYTINEVAEAYLFFVRDIKEERMFFIKQGRYRFSNTKEVHDLLYDNSEYMEKYMLGLAVSVYMMGSHRKYMKWYQEKIKCLGGGGCWLEVGPGHGEYLLKAINLTNYRLYYGIDISKTSIDICRKMMASKLKKEELKNVRLKQKDFFELEEAIYDGIVIGEVLEHVEDPERFLDKVYRITDGSSFIYITTAVNCPQKDHIHQFSTIGEVESLYYRSGFDIVDSLCIPTNGYTIEKAVKKKAAINTAHILKRKTV